MKITDPQRTALKAVLDDDYGALFRNKCSPSLLRRLMSMKLIEWKIGSTRSGYDLTPEGESAICASYRDRWRRSGCKAYADDMDAVVVAVAARREARK